MHLVQFVVPKVHTKNAEEIIPRYVSGWTTVPTVEGNWFNPLQKYFEKEDNTLFIVTSNSEEVLRNLKQVIGGMLAEHGEHSMWWCQHPLTLDPVVALQCNPLPLPTHREPLRNMNQEWVSN